MQVHLIEPGGTAESLAAIPEVTLVRILPTAIWIEDDLMGARHVMLQHEGMEAFCYASFHYGYGYTSNSGTHSEAHTLAVSLGATEPVEHRHRAIAERTMDDEALREVIEYFGRERLAAALASA